MSDAPAAPIALVNEVNFQEEVQLASTPVLIDVTAAWCPPCRAAAPVIQAIAAEYAGRLKVVEIDADQSPELVSRLGVRGLPTFIGYAGGEVKRSLAGFAGKAPLKRLADDLVSPVK